MKIPHLLIIAILLTTTVYSTGSVFACQCNSKNLDEFGVIFSGTVLNVTKNTESEDYVLFEVDRSWEKTYAQDQIAVFTATNQGACGYNFTISEKYLVYAHRTGDNLYTGICTQTKPISAAEGDLKLLGRPSFDLEKEKTRLMQIEDAYKTLEKIMINKNPDIPISHLDKDSAGIVVWINDDSNPTIEEYEKKLRPLVGDVLLNINFGDYQIITNKTLGSSPYSTGKGAVSLSPALFWHGLLFGAGPVVGLALYFVFRSKNKKNVKI